MPFTLIAHRGFSSDAPENTFAAFDLALESGFDNIELDAQLTADGVPVVIHDSTLDRTTDGTGPVAQATLEEIRRLDAGCRLVDADGEARYAGERVPTLDAVLERYAGRAHFHLELKSEEQELSARVAGLLEKHGWPDAAKGRPYEAPGLTITSFHLEQLGRSLAAMPVVRHCWLVRRLDSVDVALGVKLGVSGFSVNSSEITAEQIALGRDSGMDVRAWGLRGLDDLTRMAALGVEATTVDWPGRAREYLARRGAL